MGALAPFPHWIPEDDLLLKNAVEAGASLESLAKGAVQFSRRFTIRELQDRWHSLLYNETVASQAADQILALEPSVLNLSKPSKIFSYKGKESITSKRNVKSVRGQYYAKRKRICNEPCNSIDLSYLMGPTAHICNGGKGDCQEQLKLRSDDPNENCILGAPISNHFGFPDTGFDISVHGFDPGHVGPLEDDVPDGIMDGDCLYQFSEDMSSEAVDKEVQDSLQPTFQPDSMHKDLPQILGENLVVFSNCSGVQEMGAPETSPVSEAFFHPDNLQVKPLSTYDPGNNNFDSPISDCGASFNQLGFSLPMPTLPIWKTIGELSAPVMPIESNLEQKENSVLPEVNVKGTAPAEFDVVHSESKLKDSSNTLSEGDFVDLSSSLLNFVTERGLFCMDVDEKDIVDRACLEGLNSILLNSPSSTDPKESVSMDTCLVITEGASEGGMDLLQSGQSGVDDNGCSSKFDELSNSAHKLPSKLVEEFMCCTLNTEDPEIPCNDDVFPVTLPEPYSTEVTNTVSNGKELCDVQKASEQGLIQSTEENETPPKSIMGSAIKRSPEVGLKHMGGHGVSSEFLENNPLTLPFRHAGEDPNPSTSSPAPHFNEDTKPQKMLISEEVENSIDSFLDQQGHELVVSRSHSQNSCKPEIDISDIVQRDTHLHLEQGPGEMGISELATNFSASDLEESNPESDDDVPYFSDVEAMILDMDLGPFDEESYFAREVSRYQYEDTKKAIIRLEQGARSCMQRALASHGALAVFYGRHLKHYIKKREVSIGRGTEDVIVDIDLGKEGRANKVSRQQATIKLEEDGSFYLTNRGKYSVLVNNREVAKGQRSTLSSSCLIEIRGMRFIFETNRSFIKPYATRFERLPDGNPRNG